MRYWLNILLSLVSVCVAAQTDTISVQQEDFLITAVSESPYFDGDIKAFIQSNISYPIEALHDSVEGRVSVEFWVDTAGNTVKHEILRGVRDDLDREALRVARLIKFVTPAKQKDRPVAVRYVIPVDFFLDEQMNRRVFFDKDTSDCFEEFNERYGKWMENSLVTFWAVPPSLKRSSKKYADLICERLSEINYGNQYLVTTILIGENGKPYCCSLSSQESLEGEDRHAILDLLKSLRFNPANNGKRNVKSYYSFSPRKNKKDGRWFYPESTNWGKERRHGKSQFEGNIVESMNFTASFSQDTILMGDTVHVRLQFKNVTEVEKLFYPGGSIIVLDKSKGAQIEMFNGWGEDTFILLTGKSSVLRRLAPGAVYEIDYPLIISPSSFKKGENRLVFRYSLGISKGDVNADLLFGTVYVPEVQIFVDEF